MASPSASVVGNGVNYQPELKADLVLDYLLTHPGFLESVVIGPQISRETFQRWTLKRNNKLRRDSRRQLLSGYTVSERVEENDHCKHVISCRHPLAEPTPGECSSNARPIGIAYSMSLH